MCCLFLLAFGIGPRVALFFVWIFGDRVQDAFDSFAWPLLGLLFLPWTTLLYVIVWQSGGLSGWGWFVVGLGVLLDLGSYLGRLGHRRAGF